ncbi:uncharacterized protein LOC108112992 [Drosophila eugracilis]|uniref:uncharacterized protein LOC108112992 n=1 Tax=Drosophila eugracilis TaxID=29029 RepID=UPI0007E84F94|nr:uncharacterized protein LOC108112992 [Drosophila eugracilis]
MSLKWYLLNTTGSMTRVNTYIPKLTERPERRGIPNMAPRVQKKTNALFKIEDLDSISYISDSSRRSKRLSKRAIQFKEIKNSQSPETTCPLPPSTIPEKEPIVQDSPRMREFFIEVRQRELKDYYRQMKAAERHPNVTLLCPDCGLAKLNGKDLTQNIYCTGDKTLRRNIDRNCDQYRDLSWLWNSSAAQTHLALSVTCGGGVPIHL